MEVTEQAMICPHVVRAMDVAGFICHVQDGYLVACSEDCSALDSGDGLGFAHLSHFAALPHLPADALTLPVNTSVTRSGNVWAFDYYEDDSEPEEGAFCLADAQSTVRAMTPDETVQAYCLADGAPLFVTLDEGFAVLPVWTAHQQVPQDFTQQLRGDEMLQTCCLHTAKARARSIGLRYLAVDFLCQAVDVGLLIEVEADYLP